MSDSRLLELERLSKEGDPIARYRYRVECVRTGRPDLAGLEAGDVVAVGRGGADWPWCSYTMDCDFSRARIARRATWVGIGELRYHWFLLECCEPSHGHLESPKTGFALDDRSLALLEPARPA